jgi:hypothetical protein
MSWFRKLFQGTQKGDEDVGDREVAVKGARGVGVGGDVSGEVHTGDEFGGDQITGQKIELLQSTINNLQIGITSKELIEIFEQLFGVKDERTARVREQQDQMSKVMPQLLEWKEFHNLVNQLLTNFGQFGSNVDKMLNIGGASAEQISIAEILSLKNSWRPINRGVKSLINWSPDIKHIQIEKWVREIEDLREDINVHLGSWEETSPGGQNWVVNLVEKKNEIEDAILNSLDFADKKLRTTAQNLYNAIYRSKWDG